MPTLYPLAVPDREFHLACGATDAMLDEFRESVNAHIRYVQEAGRRLHVPQHQLDVHDDSKFSRREFGAYARHFHGGGAPDAFARAWLHHIHFNPHHWQHSMFADGYSPSGSSVEAGVVEMRECDALEMIADWMGASMAYTGSWNMAEWLNANIPHITLHSKTADFVGERLVCLGYAEIGTELKFKGAV
jgi:hypothetical protein